jgi:hypothetical protein
MGQAETSAQAAKESRPVHVTVNYLPAAEPFREEFQHEAVLETVRAQAMEFFGVQDRQERDTYRYYLEFEGDRLSNTSQTLGDLIGERRRGAHFNLIEEITPGANGR